MKKVLHVTLFFVLVNFAIGEYPAVIWDQTYGESGDDLVYDMIQTNDGKLVGAGYTTVTSGSVPWVFKIDSDGVVIWEYTYPGSRFYGLSETTNGDLVAVGYTVDVATGADVKVIKLSPDGEIIWEQVIGGGDTDIGEDVVCTEDGKIGIVATTRSYGSGLNDLWALCLDSNGTLLWDNAIGGAMSEGVKNISTDRDGNYLIAGSVDVTTNGISDAMIWKINQDGQLLWQHTYGGADSDALWDLTELPSGELLGTGGTRSSGAGDYDVWLIKTDNTGELIWQKTYGGALSDYGYSLTLTNSGNVVIAGSTSSSGPSNANIYSLTVTADGEMLGEQVIGGSNVELPTAILESSDNSIVIAGRTKSFGAGGYDGWVIKTEPYLREVRFVSTDGSPSGDGSLSNPYSNIQVAVDSSVTGDTIRVLPGTYSDNINFNGKNIVLTSSSGADVTVIQPNNPNLPIIWLHNGESKRTEIDGFTFTGASINSNGAIFKLQNGAQPLIKNCIITQNANQWSAVYGHYTGVVFENCLFHNNAGNIMFFDASNLTPSITNCTFTANASLSVEASASTTNPPVITNSIFWGNSGQNLSGALTVTNCLVEGGYFGTANINANPRFKDPSNYDYSLSDYSPCIGVGSTNSLKDDLGGNARPNPSGSNPDLGAYENSLAASLHNSFIHVSILGNNYGSVGLESAPFATIQAAIDYSVDSDTVLVQPGTYAENIDFNGKNIVLGSLFLTTQDTSFIAQTVIDGQFSGPTVSSINGENGQLSGFTIIHGNPGVKLEGNTTLSIDHCIISNNSFTSGGGIYCNNSSPTIIATEVIANTSQSGGGLYITSSSSNPVFKDVLVKNNYSSGVGGGIYLILADATIENITFDGNTSGAEGGGLWVDGCSPTINRCVFIGNTGSNGGAIASNYLSNPKINRVTIVGNTATNDGGGISIQNGTNMTLAQSILNGNTPNQLSFIENGAPSQLVCQYTNIEGGQTEINTNNAGTLTWGNGNIEVDPDFVSEEYAFLASSQCINAGHPDSTDSDGSRADMGAYPYLNSYSGPDWHTTISGDDIVGTGELSNPFASIQAGINFSESGDTIWVAPGTYTENVNTRGRVLCIRGTGVTDDVIVDGNQLGSTLIISGTETTGLTKISGLTIRNGSGSANLHPYYLDGHPRGGGIAVVNANNTLIKDCIIEDNTSKDGGGIWCLPIQDQITTIEDCTIRNNVVDGWHGGGIQIQNYSSNARVTRCKIYGNSTSGSGGGVYIQNSIAEISNCLIYGNTASSGGGVENLMSVGWATTTISQSTIVGNSSPFGGGLHLTGWDSNDWSTVYLLNSILWNNISDNGHEIASNEWGRLTAEYCLLDTQENWLSTVQMDSVHLEAGNVYLDPIFVDAANNLYNLAAYSPAIGAGLNSSNTLSSDIEGNLRPNPSGSNPDMGAYESPFGTPQHMPITINVPDDYATIQAGLNAADSTDTVLVHPGTYYENIIWPETNGIKLISAGGSSNTIIDGDASGSVIIFYNGGEVDTCSTMDGFTIRNGGNVIRGGGMVISHDSPFISNCIITGNFATNQGGGVYAYQSNAVFSDCEFTFNNAFSEGGGIYTEESGLIVRSSKVNDNQAHGTGFYTGGGGLRLQNSHVLLTDVEIANNIAVNKGGGIYSTFVYSNTSSEFIRIQVLNNQAFTGGGIQLNNDHPLISHSTIIGNNASENGGGIGCFYDYSIPVLSDVVIANNTATNGGGIYVLQNAAPQLSNVLLTHNHATSLGGAMYYSVYAEGNSTYVTMENNTAGAFAGIYSTEFSFPAFSLSNLLDESVALNNNDNLVTIDADSCWWGHSSGPYHSTINPNGSGETVSGTVDITPWLISPDINAPPIAPNNLEVTSTGNDFIALIWGSSPLEDHAGYKIYYDTNENGYPYANSLDVGTDTSYTLSGLNLGTQYFLAVTVYDTDGNESWYSQEVTGTTRVMEAQNLDIAGNEDLFHLVTHDPLITFHYFDSMGEAQTNYQIQISTDSTFQSNLIWDSGEIASDATSIQYTEGSLQNGMKYYLRTKVASGSFWSNWSRLAFGMNTEPSIPVQLSLIDNEVTTSGVLLEISNSTDAEGDNLSYDFRLYDATQTVQLDSAIGVAQGTGVTLLEVITALDDNAQHWWTVQAYDGYEYSELAGPASFLINFQNDTPSGFNLTSPIAGEAITSQSPLFTWDPAVDPDPLDTVKYVLYLDTPDPGVETYDVDVDISFQLLDVLQDNTSYHWKVVAQDLAGSTTTNTVGYQSFTVNTANDLPTAFTLLTPIADMMVTTLTPEFLWEASSDPDDETIVMRSSRKSKQPQVNLPGSGNTVQVITGYDFYLGTDAELTDVIPVEVVGTGYTPETDLLENQVYFWAVSALDDSGGVTFSDTASFWTNSVNSAPTAFELLTPLQGSETTEYPSFSWTEASDVDLQDELSYTLYYGSDITALTEVSLGLATSYIPETTLYENTEFSWQVIATDLSGATFATPFRTFTVNTANDPPLAFNLIYPANESVISDTSSLLFWDVAHDLDGSLVEYVVLQGESTENLEILDTVSTNYYQLINPVDGAYYWQVIALDEFGEETVSEVWMYLVNAQNVAPAAFTLLGPVDETVTTLTPELSWNASSDMDEGDMISYELSLGTTPDNLSVMYSGDGLSYTLAEPLTDNTTYYWQVEASDLSGATTTSTGGYQSFTINTSNDLPVAFNLLSPVADMMVTTLTPEFLWEASSDPDDETIVLRSSGKGRKTNHSSSGNNSVMVITGYDFYLGTDAELTDVIPIEVVGTSYTSEADLTENQVYYWAVSALDDSGGVTFSDTTSFWTNSENSSPAEFALLTPVDESESTMTPTFSWTMSSDADLQDTLNYTLRYGTDVFSLMDIPNGSSTQFTVVEPLEDNTDYIWQVVAADVSGAIFATEFSSFFVNSENDDPGVFSLIAPDSASWITNGDLMLVWEPSTDLEGADVEYVIHMGPDNESLEPVDTISVNYFALNALEDGYYFWQTEAIDNIGGAQFSETWSFLINVHNDPPDPFALTYPEADLVLTDQQPTFTWEASSSGDAGDHTSYRVELGNSAESMGLVYEGDSTFYTPELPLEDNSVYYWRVVAIDLAFATTVNEGGYQSFVVNTVNDSPTMAELISPDSVVVLSDIPTFSWNASTDIDPYDSLSYELHWWTDVAEMDSILTTATSVSPATPLADDNLQYFWNVITMDLNGGIAHSEEKTFWVDFMPEVPASFALLGPDSASAGNGTRPELTWAEAIDPDPFDAVHYSVAVATDSLMENVIYEQVAHVEVTIPEIDLENDTRYYWQVTAIDEDSLTTASSVWTFDVGYLATDQYAQLPEDYELDQNYPNPFNPSTTIRYGLPEEANVSLVIYDVRGQVVQTLESGHQSAGWYDVVWNGQTADGKTISTGIYFARLVASEYSQVVKLLYLK